MAPTHVVKESGRGVCWSHLCEVLHAWWSCFPTKTERHICDSSVNEAIFLLCKRVQTGQKSSQPAYPVRSPSGSWSLMLIKPPCSLRISPIVPGTEGLMGAFLRPLSQKKNWGVYVGAASECLVHTVLLSVSSRAFDHGSLGTHYSQPEFLPVNSEC